MKKWVRVSIMAFSMLLIQKVGLSQVTATSSAVNLNVDLSASLLSISLGGDLIVEFKYVTVADYEEVKTVSKLGHITVASNTAFYLQVKAVSDFSPVTLPLSTVTVEIDQSTLNGGTVPETAVVPLNRDVKRLLNSVPATLGATFNVNYSIPSPADLLSLPRANYTTTVIYTATQT